MKLRNIVLIKFAPPPSRFENHDDSNVFEFKIQESDHKTFVPVICSGEFVYFIHQDGANANFSSKYKREYNNKEDASGCLWTYFYSKRMIKAKRTKHGTK